MVMISCTVISPILILISSLASVGTLHPPCLTGGMLGSNVMGYFLRILPILLRESRKIFIRSLMLLMLLWSCNVEQSCMVLKREYIRVVVLERVMCILDENVFSECV